MANTPLDTILSQLGGLVNNAATVGKYGIIDPGGTKAILGAWTQLGKKIGETNEPTQLLLQQAGNLLAVNKNLVKEYDALNKEIAALEIRNNAINKSFGINSIAAAKLSTTYQRMANNLKTFSGEQAIVYGTNIRKMLPMYKQQGKENDTQMKNLMALQHVLTTNMQLTEEDAANYTMYASKAGENAASLMDVAKRAAEVAGDTDGSLGYMKMITEGIAAAGAEVQLQYGRLGGNLEIAVLKANKLGFELDDLARAGEDLLNIESSIGNELEYQLLSGRRLVDLQSGESLTNAYRQATLMGDMSKQAETLNTILEQEGETLENNLFARKQMSQLLGLDEASLARALQKKKILQSDPNLQVLMELDGSQLQAEAEALYKNGQITEDKLNEIAKVADTRTSDEIAKAQYDLQVENQQQLDGILTSSQANNIQLSRQTMLAQDLNAILIDEFKPTRAQALNAMRVFGYVSSAPGELTTRSGTKVDDVVIPPGGTAPIISAPAGTFILDPQDTIMAGTELMSKGTTSTANGDNLSLVMMQVGRMIVAAINSKGNNVFGATAMNSAYYQGS